MISTPSTDTPQGRFETNEAAGEIRTLAQPLWSVHVRGPDDLVAVACYDDAVRLSDGLNWWWLAQRPTEDDPWISAVPALWDGTQEHHAEQVAKLGTRGSDYGMPTEEQVEAKRVAAFKRLAETPPPVSGGASTCDRPGQADAAVAEALRDLGEGFDLIERCVKVACEDDRKNGAGETRLAGCPTYLDIRLSHITDAAREMREAVATLEAALRAAVPRELEGWRAGFQAARDLAEAVCVRREFGLREVHSPAQAADALADTIGRLSEMDLPAPPTAAPSKGMGDWEPVSRLAE